MTTVPGPILGPCTSWIGAADVAACCSAAASAGTDPRVGLVAVEASMVLFELSGRQFSGLCERTVRPCQDGCSCWGSRASGLGPWAWGGYGGAVYGGYGGTWASECGDTCGCGSLSTVRLAGYPVRDVEVVKIDGVVLAANDSKGHPNYRLDGYRNLVRMDDPGPPAVARRWPACQNLSLDDGQAGTFSVKYRYGIDPPPIGLDAASQLACQLFLACNGLECQVPQGATKVTRQGVTIDRGLLANWLDPSKPTGIVAVDAFIAAYWRGRSSGRRPAVFSPDQQPYARRLG